MEAPAKRRAKIVCTLGPATSSADAIRGLVAAGMDVARLNLSHGEHAAHAELVTRVRAAASAAGRPVGILADLQGPKIRLGRIAAGEAVLETGAPFTITVEPVLGDAHRASTTYAALAEDVRAGDAILIDDGLVRLEVESVAGGEVRTRVVEGGRISDHKGINLPGVRVSAPVLGDKDRDDLAFALGLGVDLVALSFVRAASDADIVRRAMGAAVVPVIAKLERPEAVADLEGVADAFDGLMVARGDLGVELPLERVPLVQKRAIGMARERAKPVIVATQMLESMIRHSRPTRAEASDVANAVLDGADALMLSGETSVGAHPLEALGTMARVIAAAEGDGLRPPALARAPGSPAEGIAAAAAAVARDLHARALVAFTQTGATARLLAAHRPDTALMAFTTRPEVRTRLALVWGVEAHVVPEAPDTDSMVAQVDRAMLDLGGCSPGDRVVIVAGTPPGTAGNTNTIRVHRVGSLGARP